MYFNNLIPEARIDVFANKIDKKELVEKYEILKEWKTTIPEIKKSSEKSYQDAFMKVIFESILGYKLKSTGKYDIDREVNVNGKFVDALILKNKQPFAVIELKSTKTSDLLKEKSNAKGFHGLAPIHQSALYHFMIDSTKFGIVTNFDKIIFFADKQDKRIEFSLFNMDFQKFRKFYAIFNKKNLLSDGFDPSEVKKPIDDEFYKSMKIFDNLNSKLFEKLLKIVMVDNVMEDKIPDMIQSYFELKTETPSEFLGHLIKKLTSEYKEYIKNTRVEIDEINNKFLENLLEITKYDLTSEKINHLFFKLSKNFYNDTEIEYILNGDLREIEIFFTRISEATNVIPVENESSNCFLIFNKTRNTNNKFIPVYNDLVRTKLFSELDITDFNADYHLVTKEENIVKNKKTQLLFTTAVDAEFIQKMSDYFLIDIITKEYNDDRILTVLFEAKSKHDEEDWINELRYVVVDITPYIVGSLEYEPSKLARVSADTDISLVSLVEEVQEEEYLGQMKFSDMMEITNEEDADFRIYLTDDYYMDKKDEEIGEFEELFEEMVQDVEYFKMKDEFKKYIDSVDTPFVLGMLKVYGYKIKYLLDMNVPAKLFEEEIQKEIGTITKLNQKRQRLVEKMEKTDGDVRVKIKNELSVIDEKRVNLEKALINKG